MTAEEAQVIVDEILHHTCPSEIQRLLDFFHSPKAEAFRQVERAKMESDGGLGPRDGDKRAMTHVVGK